MFKIGKAVRVVVGTPFVLAMFATLVFDVWMAYRKDPESLNEFLDSVLEN